MSFQPNNLPGRPEWTTYTTMMLLLIAVTAVATALPISQLVRSWWAPSEAVAENRASEPARKSESALSLQNVCGRWQSHTSEKSYNFICASDGLFEVYEETSGGLIKVGTGNVSDDGTVKADLVSPAKNRRGHWKLRLSSDGRTMTGPWHGDDPRESGQLAFNKK